MRVKVLKKWWDVEKGELYLVSGEKTVLFCYNGLKIFCDEREFV